MNAFRPSAPSAVRWIARTLEEAGYETWAVGGAIRDAALGRPSGDWDLATGAPPGAVRRLFRRTVPIGIDHGTVGVLDRDGVLHEVTTFRRDVETDGRHAVVEFSDRIEEDLARRDFTINAIAWHPLREELLDPFDGVGDLERRVLRTVGEATDRFREDYLRILRALRFAGRFRLTVDPSTWSALSALVDHLVELSPERVREELLKVLGADPTPSRALSLYADSGALGVLYPELEALRGGDASGTGRWAATLAAVDHLPTARPYLRLAGLLRPLDRPDAVAILLRSRLSNALVDTVARIVGAAPLPDPDAPAVTRRRWLAGHGPELRNPVARLDLAEARVARAAEAADRCAAVVASWRALRAEVAKRPPLTVGDLALDGRALIGLGLRPGPHFGVLLESLLDWVLEDPSRNDAELLAERALVLSEEAGGAGP